jgi:fatty acid desaturase
VQTTRNSGRNNARNYTKRAKRKCFARFFCAMLYVPFGAILFVPFFAMFIVLIFARFFCALFFFYALFIPSHCCPLKLNRPRGVQS